MAGEEQVAQTEATPQGQVTEEHADLQETRTDEPASNDVVEEDERSYEEMFDEVFGSDELTELDSPADPDEGSPEEGEDKKEEDISAPVSWGKESKELFSKLPPELQKQVSQRETEREKAIGTALQDKAEHAKREEAILQYAEKELSKALKDAQIAIHGEFAEIDMRALKAKDPVGYLQLEALYEKRMEAVDAVARQVEVLEKVRTAQRKKEEEARLASEFVQAETSIAALFPEYSTNKAEVGKRVCGEIAEYMKSQGAPEEHIRGISHGYQLALVAKSMLYDRMMSQAQSAKAKTEAPKMLKRTSAKKQRTGSSAVEDLFSL